jgi:inosine-uridine nucleoside N-ribohydrolase
MPIKLLLDTDIGSDIDDALCLAYLLAQPECDLLGITTVTGEAEKRAMLASVLCTVARKQIPIFPGAAYPLLASQQQPHAAQARVLNTWSHDTTFPRGQAVDFLRQTIRAHPGEIVLLTIGPLTNIALLFAVDEEIPTLLKGLVMMCGVFTNTLQGVALREWNALNDPHATAMVYRAAVRSHRSIGLDVTMQVNMSTQVFREKCSTSLLRPVLDFAEVWFEHRDSITFHDPLAATTIFDESICTFKRGTVEVELDSKRLAGLTYWEPGRTGASATSEDTCGEYLTAPRHEVALEVKPDYFFEHYFRVLGSVS